MRRALVVLAALLVAAPAGHAADRARFDTRIFALIPTPGFPAHAYVHPGGRVYEGTYDNPGGDSVPSRVFEYTGEGTLLRSWVVEGQDLSGAHGVQVATSDAAGRLVLLDKSPPRALILDRGTGAQATYAEFPEGAVPNYAAWGPDGSLYVTDYENAVLWRIPPRGGAPERWLESPLLDGGPFGSTGLQLMADGATLLVAVQSEAGGGAGNPSSGRLLRVPIGADGRPGPVSPFWESRPADGPDGFAIGQSGSVYVALLVANAIAVVGPDGTETERAGDPLFDSPSSAQFLGERLMVANQSFFTGDRSRQAILDVYAGEPGLERPIPANAGPARVAPAASGQRRRRPRAGHWRGRGVRLAVIKDGPRTTVRRLRVQGCALGRARVGRSGRFRTRGDGARASGRFTTTRRMVVRVRGAALCAGTYRATWRR